ncbi:unnamed protein product [Prorocentrum cordatum]|uniref:Large ribosomal subunit protein uL15/eL18 domain-containing protein n=1 Tax=Prorocentrum cordatum TaxID=2364126 RepID=A0ABN9QWV9_9DINO|nr:unnamed protein product [Polarella glacialis]
MRSSMVSSSEVGMRNFHLIKHGKVCPLINVDKLWSLVPEGTREQFAAKKDKAPFRMREGAEGAEQGGGEEGTARRRMRKRWRRRRREADKAPVIDVMKAGYMKVCGKGQLPEQPLIVKARYFTKEAEVKIKDAGGVCVLVA